MVSPRTLMLLPATTTVSLAVASVALAAASVAPAAQAPRRHAGPPKVTSHHARSPKNRRHHTGHGGSAQQTEACPSWNDMRRLTMITKVRATNLNCATARAVEVKLEPSLMSGSGPHRPVIVVADRLSFTCTVKLRFAPNKQSGPGSCTAAGHRRLTFVAAEFAQ